MRLTKTQTHALRLLNIQEDKRGFVRQGTLRQAGIPRVTLDQLRSRKLVECRRFVTKSVFQSYNHAWRLTLAGIKAAEALPPFKPSH